MAVLIGRLLLQYYVPKALNSWMACLNGAYLQTKIPFERFHGMELMKVAAILETRHLRTRHDYNPNEARC